MTAWRTAAATAIAAHCLSPVTDPVVGLVGTGLQAQLAPAWISKMLPSARFVITGRDPTKTSTVAAKIGATPIAKLNELLAVADIVITATPSAEPLFTASHVRPGTHFVALGADSPEKQELPTELFARATHVLCDDIQQCAVLSDFGKAVGAGAISLDRAIALGAVLARDVSLTRMRDDITVVDLTGLAAQDIAIADWFGAQLA